MVAHPSVARRLQLTPSVRSTKFMVWLPVRHLAIIAIMAATWLPVPSNAVAGCLDHPDHLDPPDATLTSYDWSLEYLTTLRKVLKVKASQDLYFRAVVMPAFFPEWSITISRPSGGRANVELVEAKSPVYAGQRPRTPGTTKSVAEIDGIVAESLRAILEKMLLETRPCAALDGRIGFDGVTYQMSGWVRNYGVLGGETWSPDEATRAGRLVAAVNLLYGIARGEQVQPRDAHEQLRTTVAGLASDVLGNAR